MAKISDIIAGLQLLCKYVEKGEETHLAGADHEIIYSPVHIEHDISSEDLNKLEELGWHKDEDSKCWSNFV